MFHRLFFIGLLIYTFSVVHVTSSDSEQVKVSGVDHLLDENTQEGLTDENSRDIEEDADFDEEMLYYGLDLGTPQTLYDDFEEQSVEKIVQARSYMKNEGSAANKSCRNNHESCAYWAVAGECERAQQFMARTCAPMCGFCHMKEPEPDCAVSDNALQPGDLNILFERIVSDPALKQFEPRVISRPTLAPGDTIGSAEYIVGGPWLVVFENTLSDEETDRLIELGNKKGFLRSMNGGAAFNGAFQQSVDTKRTSETAWCDQECLDDSLAFGVVSRIENITSIPHGYSEHLQLLRYTDGQYYKLHHDYIPQEVFLPNGPRILTFYIYLNDVEEGGGTNFPYLDPSVPDFAVQPKRGRAVLWPSVLNEQPDVRDDRTMHQALPVTAGVKYGANAWIHLREFKTNLQMGCTLR